MSSSTPGNARHGPTRRIGCLFAAVLVVSALHVSGFAQEQTPHTLSVSLSDFRVPLRLRFSEDGDRIIALIGVEYYGRIRQWDLESGEIVEAPWGSADRWWTDGITEFAITLRGIAIARQDEELNRSTHIVEIWDFDGSTRVVGQYDNRVYAMASSPDGQLLAVGGLPPRGRGALPIKVWDLQSGEELVLRGDGKSVVGLEFTAACRSLMSSTSEWHPTDGGTVRCIRVWNLAEGEESAGELLFRSTNRRPIWDASYLFYSRSDHSLIVTGHDERSYSVFSLETRELSGTFVVPTDDTPVRHAFSADNNLVALSFRDESIRILDRRAGLFYSLNDEHHEDDPVIHLRISPDESKLAVGRRRSIDVYDLTKILHEAN